MTTFSFYLLLYIVGIVWCKWSFTKVWKDKLWDSITEKMKDALELYINIISWLPLINIMVGDMTSDKTFANRCGFQYRDQAQFFKI